MDREYIKTKFMDIVKNNPGIKEIWSDKSPDIFSGEIYHTFSIQNSEVSITVLDEISDLYPKEYHDDSPTCFVVSCSRPSWLATVEKDFVPIYKNGLWLTDREAK